MDWSACLQPIVKQCESLKGGHTPAQNKAFALLRASAQAAQAVCQDDSAEIDKKLKAVRRAYNALLNALE